jgi:hypothetical protein
MKTRRRHNPKNSKTAPRPRFVCVALLVICALLAHSLDNCAAHLGAPLAHAIATSDAASNAQQLKAPCPHTFDTCEICKPANESHQDGCEQISETAVLTSSQNPLEHQAVTLGAGLAATVAVIPAMPQLIALSGSLHGRAGPPPALPRSVFLRSSLPSRAPPLSA